MIALFLVFFLFGILAFVTADKPDGLRYKGLAQKALGKEVIPFVHRLLGILLMLSAAVGSIWYFFFPPFSNKTFFWGYLLSTLLCFLISDGIALLRFKGK